MYKTEEEAIKDWNDGKAVKCKMPDTEDKKKEADSEPWQGVIYTPHYQAEKYLYHECSECKYHVKIKDDYLGEAINFGEKFKFCPECGGRVTRFACIPVFEEDINRAIFERAEKIVDDMELRLRHYLYIELTDEEREQLASTARFAMGLEAAGGPMAGKGAENIAKKCWYKLNRWDRKRLEKAYRERFEKGNDDE